MNLKVVLTLCVLVVASGCASRPPKSERNDGRDVVLASLIYYLERHTNLESIDRTLFIKSIKVSGHAYEGSLPTSIISGQVGLARTGDYRVIDGLLRDAASGRACTSVAIEIDALKEASARVGFHWYQGPTAAGGLTLQLRRVHGVWSVIASTQDYIAMTERPNKTPEPTPRPVTIPAEPGIAPVRVVAHL